MTQSGTPKTKKPTSSGLQPYVMLMFEYLRLSPSYALAARISHEKLSKAEQAELVSQLYQTSNKRPLSDDDKLALLDNFKPVLKTFEEHGDLISVNFATWWEQTGQYLYDQDGSRPRTYSIAQLEKGGTLTPEVMQQINRYFDVLRERDDQPAAVIMAIPLGIPKKKQLELVSKSLDKHKISLPIKAAKSRRPLAAERLRNQPLIHGIGLLWVRAGQPKLPLWKVGAVCKVSPTYSAKIDPLKDKALEKNIETRQTLTTLTYRMMKRAQLIAENAAHGLFPSHSVRPLPRFDTEEVYLRMIKYKPELSRNKKSKPKLKQVSVPKTPQAQ